MYYYYCFGVVRTECVLMRSYMPYNFIMFKQSFYGVITLTHLDSTFSLRFLHCFVFIVTFSAQKLLLQENTPMRWEKKSHLTIRKPLAL